MEAFHSSPCKGPLVVILPPRAVVQTAAVAGTGAAASCLQVVSLPANAPAVSAAAWMAAASAFVAAPVPMFLLMLLLLVLVLLLGWLLPLLLLLLLQLFFS